jgi:two-component system cell cycle response regulator
VPDLILLDIMMPNLNGYEVTARIKGNAASSHIPIILVTALDNPEDRTKGLTSGADEFLTKPVNKTELIARVSSMLRLKKYHEQLSLRTQAEEKFVDGKSRPAAAHPTGKPLPRVLAVEDNPLDLKLIRSYLDRQAYELITADSGEAALDMAAREKIDVMLLDVVLPGMDGFEVCRRLKADARTRNIQDVMITGLSDLESKIMGVEQGADDFLVKPINKREIQARILALLRKKSYLDQICSHYEMAISSAIMDDLTGLYNRAYFINSLELEIKRSRRQKYTIALTMMDIDDFKLYNDRIGHLDGDMLLRELSQVIRLSVREVDMAVRYGGEEFAIIMPYTDRAEAVTATERVLDMIRTHPYSNARVAKVKPVTMSAGVAVFPEDAESVNGLICRADEMLYKAKRGGKDQVVSRGHAGDRPRLRAC